MPEPSDTIEKLTKMFALVDTPASSDGHIVGGFKGFVIPPEYIHSYGQVALSVKGEVTIAPNKSYSLYGGFASIDDAGLSIFAPFESKEKALKRLAVFREQVELWHPFMPPTFADWDDWAKKTGLTVSAW